MMMFACVYVCATYIDRATCISVCECVHFLCRISDRNRILCVTTLAHTLIIFARRRGVVKEMVPGYRQSK